VGSHQKAFHNATNFEEEHNQYKEQIYSLKVETKYLKNIIDQMNKIYKFQKKRKHF
jgi:hypothetical protein